MGLNVIAVAAVSGAEGLMIPAQTNVLFPDSSTALGTTLSVMAISAIGGALTAGFMRSWPQRPMVNTGWIIYALALGAVSLTNDRSTLLVCVAVLGYSGAMIDTLLTVMMQRAVHGRHRAKLFGVMSIILHLGDITSLWLTTLVVSAIGFAAAFQVAALAALLVAATAFIIVRPGDRNRCA